MAKEILTAAFEGGKLRLLASGETGGEAALALPLSRLLVKMIRVPAEEDPVGFAVPVFKALNPFPDDELTVSCELVREDEQGKVMIAAALPESAADDIGEALDAAKLSVVRIDSLALGQLRGVWNALGESSGRRAVLLRSEDCISLVVLDGDQPSAIRAITDVGEIRRELMLSLLEAEDFGGARKLEEIVVVEPEDDRTVADSATDPDSTEGDRTVAVSATGAGDLQGLSSFAPLRTITVGRDAALVGVAERTADAGALNALPQGWRDLLEETRFKRKLVKCLAIAGGIWLLVMAVLFGVPVVYGFLTDHQKTLIARHRDQYREVSEMRTKVEIVGKYSDHQRGALEIMKAVSDRLPESVELSSWNFRQEEGLSVAGEADDMESIYKFKEAMDALAVGEGDDAEKVFGEVVLNDRGLSKGKYRFELDCRYQAREEGE